ncbi:Wzz/FepE/Etk N-terminal domain-containing protein [Streptococcus henryi]|uniref:Wzz/FepE/Etk N-terminal domain-containing protein n=1 Tax=Streptococcus henryi TaxID=439219 RepID=UPI00037ADDFD|nr:Wzz/FepE/Etk N-terminal domain-containing protein [Streptococcus henryi]
MNTKENTSNEIDVVYLLKKLWTKKFLIIFMSLFVGTLSLIATIFLIEPEYTATTRVYVVGQSSESVTTQDLQAGSYLVKDYQEIIKSSDVLAKVIAKEESPLSTAALSNMISVNIPTDTRVISISVESKDPEEAAQLTNRVREVAAEKIKEVTKVQDVTTLEEAQIPEKPSSPNTKRNLLLGALVGAFLAIIGVLFTEILDDRVKRAEDVEEVLGLTLLGVVPNTEKM